MHHFVECGSHPDCVIYNLHTNKLPGAPLRNPWSNVLSISHTCSSASTVLILIERKLNKIFTFVQYSGKGRQSLHKNAS